jgi:hypothetical protein
MAEAKRRGMKALAMAVLLMGAWLGVLAQSPGTASLSGRLTDLYAKPLEGVSLVARNQATGVETRTITGKNGAYRFDGLEPGEYSLEAESPALGRGHLEGIQISAGYEARVLAAMAFEPLPQNPVLEAAQEPRRPEFHPPHPEIALLPQNEVTWKAEPLPLLTLPVRPLVEAAGARPPSGPKGPADFAVLSARLKSCPDTKRETESNSSAVCQTGQTTPKPAPAAAKVAVIATIAPASVVSQVPKAGPGAPAVLGTASTISATSQLPKAGAAAPTALNIRQSPVSKARPGPPDAVSGTTGTISAAELQALPVSGRHWQDFVLDLTPTSATPAGGEAETTLRGAGQSPPGIAVDGANRTLAFGSRGGSGHGSSGRGALGESGADPAGMARIGVGGHGLAVSEAAIREVQTAAGNVEAAAARAAGGRMSVETASGSNKLHGQGFLFDRQNAWGAHNPYSQWTKETAAATTTWPLGSVPVFTPEPYTPADRETTWGIGMGSRIRRDKLFWFAALDGSDRNDPGVSMVKHPYICANATCTEQGGFFAQPSDDKLQVLAERLGLSQTNEVVEGLAAYSPVLETLAGLLGPAPRTATQWTGFGRLDWQAAERHRFTLEGIGARWNAPGGGLSRVTENYGNHSFGSTKANEEWLLGRWEAFVTPNLLAVTQVSFGHTAEQARPETPSAYEKTFLTGSANAWGQLPQIVVDNRYGFTIGNPSRFGKGDYPDERLYHAQESVDWVRGKLLVKAGFDWNHNYDATSLLRNQTGTYTYSSVENFASDALAFETYGLTGALANNHNCDPTGKVWRDSDGVLKGRGNLPCYSHFSQTIGPADWRLSTSDLAGYATAQWQAGKFAVVSAGLRWERELLPPPIALVKNSDLPLTEKLPSLGSQWGPRVSLAVGNGARHWPVLQLGYGMYFGRTENATLLAAMSQTGSLKGDLSFFMRPTDNLNGSGAPPFPYVLRGTPGSAIMPGAVAFAHGFRNPEIHQAVVAVKESLPGHIEVTASAMASLGRRLPVSIDTNLDTPTATQTITYNVCDETLKATGNTTCGHNGLGPIKATQITVPFYASWPASEATCQSTSAGFSGRPNPCYQQITSIESRANSTYEAATLKIVRMSRRGLSLRAHYTYSHAMDWNPNESSQAAGNDLLETDNFKLEYGTSDLDMRHSAAAWAIYEAPWKLQGLAGKLGNGWMISGVGQYHSGLPYTMRTSGSLAEELTNSGAAIVGLGPGMNGSGGDNRVYGVGNDNVSYNIGRNTYRYTATWKADLRLGRRFDLGSMRQLEVLAESFNLLNHQNVTEVETTGYTIESGTTSTLPSLNFLTGRKTNTTAFGQPMNVNATNFYRERQIELGLRLRF